MIYSDGARKRSWGIEFHSNYIPSINFTPCPLPWATGDGEFYQPFRNIQDHENWIRRATAFGPWADSAIVYLRKGMTAGFVIAEALVVKK